MVSIVKATKKNSKDICPLFNSYRVFYKQESDMAASFDFIKKRLEQSEAVIFLAYIKDVPVGFTLLYKTFSSVSMQPSFILNDLFVDSSQRKKGVGEALLNKAKEYCIEKNYKGLALETDMNNPAQKLYEKLDWKKDSHCFHYFWSANKGI
ncbi:MAG: GNAT family N-acetyltransferase [Flavobacteriaceae bacterium]|nr:MAG: GNAT family N-acetyltransferase [Flavobacteriaceae bacterium]